MPTPLKSKETPTPAVVRYAEAELPTEHGPARIVVYREPGLEGSQSCREHVALLFGRPEDETDEVLVRVHSECLTSEVLGSLKCDCRAQLDGALAQIKSLGTGVLVYLRQEGRGIGLGNKIKAYALQSKGADTVDANQDLGFEADHRNYDIAAHILQDLHVDRVALLTNNPRKLDGLRSGGIETVRRVAMQVPATLHSAGYLETKRARLGHLLDSVPTPPHPHS